MQCNSSRPNIPAPVLRRRLNQPFKLSAGTSIVGLCIAIATLITHFPVSAETTNRAEHPSPENLAAHKAIYEVNLAAQSSGGTIDHVSGMLTIDISQNCSSTLMTQSMSLRMTMSDGTPYYSAGEYFGLEHKGGDEYEFQINTLSNGIEVEHYIGTAARPGLAEFSAPAQTNVSLSQDVNFPLHHLAATLAAAQRGEDLFHASYFGGVQPVHAPYAIDARIDGPFAAQDWHQPDVDSELAADPLLSEPWWRIDSSFYGSQSISPDYGIFQEVQANGIVRQFLFDYGQIKLMAKLRSVSPHPPMVCDERDPAPAP